MADYYRVIHHGLDVTAPADELAILAQMQEDGEISSEEYDDLSREVGEFEDITAEKPQTANSSRPAWLADWVELPSLRPDLEDEHLVYMAVAAVVLLLSSSLGLAPWLVTILLLVSLGATVFEGGKWITITGAAMVPVILLAGLFDGEPAAEPQDESAVLSAPSPTTVPNVPGSLEVSLTEVAEKWNSVAGPPQITKGFVINTEPGEYDSFIYRFGDWGRLAGAYDPESGAVHALAVSGQYSGEATEQLYMHLCFVVQPYSQECIDSYFEQGLDYGTLDDLVNFDHHAEWQLEDQLWKLDFEGNVLTIRVLGSSVGS